MQNILVHLTNTKKVFDHSDPSEKLITRLNDLMRENCLQQVYQSEYQDQIWMIFKMEDMEILRMVIQPMTIEWGFDAEIVPLRRKF